MVSQQGPPEMTHRPDVPRQDNNGGQSFRRNSRFGPPIDTQVEAMPPNDRSRPYMSQGPEAKFNNRPPTPPHLPPSSALRSNYKGGPPDRPPDRRDHPAPRGGRLGQGHMGVYNAPREMDRSGFPMRRRSPSPVPAIGEAFEGFEKGAIDRYPQRGYDRQRESYARDGRHDIRQAFPNSEVRQQQRWDRFPIPEREPSPPRPAPMNIPPAISTSPKVQQLTAPAPPPPSTSMPAPVTETEPALVPRASQPVRIRRPPRTESFVERERASDEQIAGRVETMGIHDAWGDRAGSRRTLMDRIADNGNGSGMMPRGATLRDRLGGVDSGREHGNGNRDGYGSRNGSVGDEGEGEGEGEEGGLMRNGDGKGRPKKKQKGRRY
ncbi:hypothetical protein OF83DRAFT_897622 [Amylostereum chailletii]|nr:hypothetical protein OF83DRAFT_897622 [Amylostereum chailletii]